MKQRLLWCVLLCGGWAALVAGAFSPLGPPWRKTPTTQIQLPPLFLAFFDWKQEGGGGSSVPQSPLFLKLSFFESWPWNEERKRQETMVDNDLGENDYNYYSKAIEMAQAVRSGIPNSVDGIYQISSEEQYRNFMKANSDKLVILSITSPYCRACRELKQKFRTLHHQDPQHFGTSSSSSRLVLGTLIVSNNPHVEDAFSDFVTFNLGVVQIPSVRFYANAEEVGRSNCHPSTGCSWKTIKSKMIQFVQDYEGFVRAVYHRPFPVDSLDAAAAAAAAPSQQQQQDPLPSTTIMKTAATTESLIGCDDKKEAIMGPDTMPTTNSTSSVLSPDEQRIVDAVLSLETNDSESGDDESMLDAILKAVKTPTTIPSPTEETISSTVTNSNKERGISSSDFVIPMQAIFDDVEKIKQSAAGVSVQSKEQEQIQNVVLQRHQKLPWEVGKKVNKVKSRQQPKLQGEIYDWISRYFNRNNT